jgi:hypothetical protein
VEPRVLKRGKLFHRKIQTSWLRSIIDGHPAIEHSITLHSSASHPKHIKRGRLDIFIDELGSFVSIVEIKSTNWDRIKKSNISRLLSSHRRQLWKYIDEYIDFKKIDVCAGIIYPKKPFLSSTEATIEALMNDYGIQVVWQDQIQIK